MKLVDKIMFILDIEFLDSNEFTNAPLLMPISKLFAYCICVFNITHELYRSTLKIFAVRIFLKKEMPVIRKFPK